MPVMNFSSLMSPQTHLSFLSSPSQPYGYSPPTLPHSLSTPSPSQPYPPYPPSSSYSPAFSPHMYLPDHKSLSRYRVLDSQGMGGGGVGGEVRVR